MRLIVAEKPSVARAICEGIGGEWARSEEGYRQRDLIVSWSVGHLVELAPPERYRAEWKSWRFDTLPMIPEGELRLRVRQGEGLSSRRGVLKKLLRAPELSEVINACDAGREGELIFDQLTRWAGCEAPRRRMWFSSTTPSAIRDAWEGLLADELVAPLRLAARARARSDWIVGLNGTRAVTLGLSDAIKERGGVLSVGRVQTPTLALIARREREREAFKSQTQFHLSGEFSHTEIELPASHTHSPFSDREPAQRTQRICESQSARIEAWESRSESEPPPKMFDLGELQARASAEMGWSAQKTLQSAQRLYESGLISYPRSDSTQLSRDLAPALRVTLRRGAAGVAKLVGGREQAWSSAAEHAQGVGDVFFIEPAALASDHHAIIPTSTALSAAKTSDHPLLGLVWKRTLQALGEPVVWHRGRCEIGVQASDGSSQVFVSKPRSAIELGWRALDHELPARGQLPRVEVGEEVKNKSIGLREKKTQPPRRYTDGSLLRAMRSAGREIEDEAARAAMRENGLGTAATRAQIIERLIEVGYVERERAQKKNAPAHLRPTPLGMDLISILEKSSDRAVKILLSPELTGEWERKLREVERAAASDADRERAAFDQEVGELTVQLIGAVRELSDQASQTTATQSAGTCPSCGRALRESEKGFSCWTPAHPGCGLTLWKTVARKRLSSQQLQQLITKGETTQPVSGLRARSGAKFSAKLRVNKDRAQVEMVFEDQSRRSNLKSREGGQSRSKRSGSGAKSSGAKKTRSKRSGKRGASKR